MKKLFFLAFILGFNALVSSCTKQGCIDSKAKNYNSKANSSDNSCIYEEKVSVWVSQNSAQDLISSGVTAVKWYIDGQFVSSHAASEYSASAPTCSSGGGQLTTTISLGSLKTKTVQLEAKDQNNESLGSDTYTITAGNCLIIEI